jgi:hypothetical protein
VPLAAGATGLNYIIHNGDTKDLPTDQRLDLTGNSRETWLLAGVPQRLLPAVVTAGGGVADLGTSKAVLLDRTTVAWQAGPTDGRIYDLVYAPAGALTIVNGDLAGTYSSIRLTARRNGITESQRVSFPDLWQYGAFGIAKADRPLIAKALRGQVVVTERDAGGKLLSATGVQTTAVPTASNVPLK